MSQSPDDETTAPSKSYIEGWTAMYEMIREGKSWSGRERKNCFLNTGGERFADISAVSGADFPDDGRGLAVVDWDLDGGLDLWMSARTAPRVRFLHNRHGARKHYVAVRLEGRTSNRDAVGARVELHGAQGPPLVQHVTGGDAYLAQSSKWVHFGLGDSTAIERLVVAWPGGEREEFAGLAADRRFVLIQGSGRAEPWQAPRPRIDLPPPREMAEPPLGAVRTYLAARLPLHGLEYLTEDGSRSPIQTDGEHGLLVTLWASWCEHCQHELTDLQKARSRVERADLRVLALSVDEPEDRKAAREFLASLDWSFEQGYADTDLLDVLSILRQSIVDMPGTMVLPTNFLVDKRHELAAVYRGPLALDTLLGDVASLDLEPAARRDRAVPFAGRWLRPPPEARSTEVLANLLRSRGHAEVAMAYLGGLEMPAEAPDWARSQRAESFEYLGRSLAAERKHTEAISAYSKGLEIDPLRASLQRAMGQSLLELQRLDAAVRHFENAVRLEPQNAGAHFDLGTALAQSGKIDPATAEFRRALELSRPGEAASWLAQYNLAVAFEAHGDLEQAFSYTNQVLEQQPEFFDALRFLGYLHQRRNDPRGAIGYYEKALTQKPDEPMTLLQLGMAHLQAGDGAAARREHDRLRSIDPASAKRLEQAIAASATR